MIVGAGRAHRKERRAAANQDRLFAVDAPGNDAPVGQIAERDAATKIGFGFVFHLG